jgi:DNA-binding XRE family transcriptional regulator
MMDISSNSWLAMSDGGLVETIGAFVKHHRLLQNKTQQQLAIEAGINRSTHYSWPNWNKRKDKEPETTCLPLERKTIVTTTNPTGNDYNGLYQSLERASRGSRMGCQYQNRQF